MIDVCCAIVEYTSPSGGVIVLAAQKARNSHLAGLYEFPGGKIESHETPTQALHREIQEELGCRIAITDSLPPCEHDYKTHAVRLYPFIARLLPGSWPICREHAALLFLKPARLQQLPWAPADRPILEDYLQQRHIFVSPTNA